MRIDAGNNRPPRRARAVESLSTKGPEGHPELRDLLHLLDHKAMLARRRRFAGGEELSLGSILQDAATMRLLSKDPVNPIVQADDATMQIVRESLHKRPHPEDCSLARMAWPREDWDALLDSKNSAPQNWRFGDHSRNAITLSRLVLTHPKQMQQQLQAETANQLLLREALEASRNALSERVGNIELDNVPIFLSHAAGIRILEGDSSEEALITEEQRLEIYPLVQQLLESPAMRGSVKASVLRHFYIATAKKVYLSEAGILHIEDGSVSDEATADLPQRESI